MKKIRFLANLMNEIRRSDRELTERIYLALSVISEIMVFFALIGDFIVKENPIEIAILILVLIFVPLFAWFGLRWNCISFFIKLTVIIVNFGILPGLFFFGGGLRGGGVLWIIFGFTYAGLVLTGRWRKVILVVIILLALLFYILDYYCPELVYKHTSEDYHIDSYFSIVLVGVIDDYKNMQRNTEEFRTFVQNYIDKVVTYPYHIEIVLDVGFDITDELKETITIRRGDLYALFESRTEDSDV